MYRKSVLIGLVMAAAIVASATAASAASPSETLEKAIYTEQTVGNVDEAIKLYQQVIDEAKTVRAAAAQAEFRLAQCLFKKNKTGDANAALEKLIKDYPDEKEWVAKARKQLPSEIKLRPAPWQDHEAQQINLKLATGLDVGTYIYMIDSAKHDGKDVWRCSTRVFVAINSAQGYSTVLAEKESFAPITSRWMHSLLGDVEATYLPTVVKIKDLLKNSTREITIDGPVFDNEECAELFRRLPLEVGYKTTIPVVSTLGGGKIPLGLEVTGKETIEVAAGKFECFKIVLNIGQTFWISTDEHRYAVKFEAGGAVAELAKVYHLEPGKPLKFDAKEFSVTLPERWFAYTPKPLKKDKPETTAILDEMGVATATVEAKAPAADLKGKSLREREVAEADEQKKALKDFKLRTDGIAEGKLAGSRAVTLIADYSDDGKPMVAYARMVAGEKVDVTFAVNIAADKFDAYRKSFDKMVESVELK